MLSIRSHTRLTALQDILEKTKQLDANLLVGITDETYTSYGCMVECQYEAAIAVIAITDVDDVLIIIAAVFGSLYRVSTTPADNNDSNRCAI